MNNPFESPKANEAAEATDIPSQTPKTGIRAAYETILATGVAILMIAAIVIVAVKDSRAGREVGSEAGTVLIHLLAIGALVASITGLWLGFRVLIGSKSGYGCVVLGAVIACMVLNTWVTLVGLLDYGRMAIDVFL